MAHAQRDQLDLGTEARSGAYSIQADGKEKITVTDPDEKLK